MSTFFSKLFNREQTDFAALVKQGAIIIDVRTIGEYKSGHIKGSRNIPLDSIKGKLAEIRKLQKPVITVCRSGARSGMAKSILLANGMVAYNGGAWDHLERKL
jgi:phage shock protein E